MSKTEKMTVQSEPNKMTRVPKGFFAQFETESIKEVSYDQITAGMSTSPSKQTSPTRWDSPDVGYDF